MSSDWIGFVYVKHLSILFDTEKWKKVSSAKQNNNKRSVVGE